MDEDLYTLFMDDSQRNFSRVCAVRSAPTLAQTFAVQHGGFLSSSAAQGMGSTDGARDLIGETEFTGQANRSDEEIFRSLIQFEGGKTTQLSLHEPFFLVLVSATVRVAVFPGVGVHDGGKKVGVCANEDEIRSK